MLQYFLLWFLHYLIVGGTAAFSYNQRQNGMSLLGLRPLSSGWHLEVLRHPGVSELLGMILLNALMKQPVEPEAIFTL